MCVASSATYGKLPPLNPDDLKLPPPPPSAADKVTNHADAISLREVWEELKAKTKAMYVTKQRHGLLYTEMAHQKTFGVQFNQHCRLVGLGCAVCHSRH